MSVKENTTMKDLNSWECLGIITIRDFPNDSTDKKITFLFCFEILLLIN